MSDTTDWQGRLVPPDEPDDKIIKVWQVSPHPDNSRYDCYVERSWRNMLDFVANNLDLMLERESVAEDGLKLEFKVVEMTVGDYREIAEGGEGDIVSDDIKRQPTPADQPPPKPSSGDIWRLVIADMEQRRLVGIERYGTPLQARNGRDALMDGYFEALDLAVYLRQAIEERDS